MKPWRSRPGEPIKLPPLVTHLVEAAPSGAACDRGNDSSNLEEALAHGAVDDEPPKWTSRQAVADALTTIAEAAGEARASDAAALLRSFATPSHAPRLLALARARDRPFWGRTYALRAYRATGSQIPHAALVDLLDEQIPDAHTYGAAICRCATCSPLDKKLDLAEVIRLASTPLEQQIVIALLGRLPREACAELLSWERMSVPSAAPAILACLEQRWLAGLDDLEPTDRDLWIARWSLRDQPCAGRVLLRHHARGPHRGDDFWDDLASCPALAALLDDGTRREAALALALPLCDLLPNLGADGLRRAVRAAIHAESFRVRCPIARDTSTRRAHNRAIEIVEKWSEGEAIARSLLRGAVLAPRVRADLVMALFRRDRALAQRVLSTRLGAADDRQAMSAVLAAVVRAPLDADRPFLRAVLRVHDADARYRALDALDALDEGAHAEGGAAYHDALRVLARSDEGFLRVRASFSLARAGDAAHAYALVTATHDADATVRAEAVRRLGQLPCAETNRALFEAALTDHAHGADDYYRPVAEQAALALGTIGDERSLTPLLSAYFALRSNPGQSAIEAAIEVILAEVEGRADLARPRRERVADANDGMAGAWSPVGRYRWASVDD